MFHIKPGDWNETGVSVPALVLMLGISLKLGCWNLELHFNVCTSTDNTADKCSAIAFQLFPPSGEQ